MSDEISQVVEMECRGVYYLLKGSKEFIALMAKALRALMIKYHTHYLNKPGNCDWKKMQEISNGTPPILEFPKEMFEEKLINVNLDGTEVYRSDFDLYCEKYDLRYCIMPDLNPRDDYIPVAVPVQDVGIHKEQIKAVMEKRISGEEEKDHVLEAKIVLAKEKILNAKTEAQKKEAEKELSMLLDAKAENADLLKESKDKMSHENEIDFAQYLKRGEGSLFERDPEKAMEQEKMCGIVREYEPYDCMWPVRDEDHVPKSKEIFYSQTTKDEKIHVIKREFKKDDHGNIFSEYRVRIPGTSEVQIYSDYGFSKEQWEKQIPKLLKSAGLANGEKTAVVQSEERFKQYQKYVEANFRKASKEKTPLEAKAYSSKEAEAFVTNHNENVKDKHNFEEMMNHTTLTVSAEKVMKDENEYFSLEVEEGLVKGITLTDLNEKSATIELDEKKVYKVVTPDGEELTLSGAEIAKKMDERRKEHVSKAAGRGR